MGASVINDDLARIKVLKTELSTKHRKKELDGFCLYLYVENFIYSLAVWTF